MPELDSILTLMVSLFVFYIQFVIHTNIGRYGGRWERVLLDARRNIPDQHLATLAGTNCYPELEQTSGHEQREHLITS